MSLHLQNWKKLLKRSDVKFFKKSFDNRKKCVIISFALKACALVAQLDRAFGYGPKGWEFEPSLARKTYGNTVQCTVFLFEYVPCGVLWRLRFIH